MYSVSGATLADSQGMGTILNDDGVQPSLTISDRTVTEGNSGTHDGHVHRHAVPSSASTVTVNYATANGTATSGTDYTAASGTLTFAPGVTSQTVTVNVTGDEVYEPSEHYYLNLSGASGATLGDSQGLGTITNDDPAPPTLSANNPSVTEGPAAAATFTVTLSAVSTSTVTVNYATSNSSAPSGSDYTATSGTLTFAPGETSKTVTVPILDDALYENNETFTLVLSSPVNATVASNGTATITNDDAMPSVTVNDVSVTETNSGQTVATFTLTLGAPSGATTSVYLRHRERDRDRRVRLHRPHARQHLVPRRRDEPDRSTCRCTGTRPTSPTRRSS